MLPSSRELDLVDLVDDLADAAARRVALEVLGEQAGVELVGIGILDLVLGEEAVLRPPAAAAKRSWTLSSKTRPSRKRGDSLFSHIAGMVKQA